MEILDKKEQIREEIIEEKLKDKVNVKYIKTLQQMLNKLHKKYIKEKQKWSPIFRFSGAISNIILNIISKYSNNSTNKNNSNKI